MTLTPGPPPTPPARASRSPAMPAPDSLSTAYVRPGRHARRIRRGRHNDTARRGGDKRADAGVDGGDPAPGRGGSSQPASTQCRITRARSHWVRNAVRTRLAVGGDAGQVGDEVDLQRVVDERPERGLPRRVRIRGDDGRRAGQGDQQRTLAGVRQPDDRHVDRQPQLERQPGGLAGRAGHGLARRLVGRGPEDPVPDPAVAAAGDHDAIAGGAKLRDDRLVAHDARARRHVRPPHRHRCVHGGPGARRCRRLPPCGARRAGTATGRPPGGRRR